MNAGDFVFYKEYGVMQVKRIDTWKVGEFEKKFFVLTGMENRLTVMVPVDQIIESGVRALCTVKTAEKAVEIVRDRTGPINNQTWNMRYRTFMEEIKSGDILRIALVARDLVGLRKYKDLSFGERKMLDQACSLISQEIALVHGISVDHAAEMVHHAKEAL